MGGGGLILIKARQDQLCAAGVSDRHWNKAVCGDKCRMAGKQGNNVLKW